MTNVLLSILMAMMSFNIFNMNFKISSLDKSLFNMPKSVFENSIDFINYHEGDKLMFDKELLEFNVNSYFSTNINPNIGSYNLRYFYFKSEDGLVCKDKGCDGVRITLNSHILLNVNYEKSMSYKIQENVL